MKDGIKIRAYNLATRFFGNPMVVNEHFVPARGLEIAPYLERGDATAVHHLLRYQWAVATLADHPAPTNILDMACGSGYGSAVIAARFPLSSVVGADYDTTAIRYAKEHYRLLNLNYVQADAHRWDETLGDVRFDCVVSFDTLEHSAHREIFMENLVRHLNPGGWLLLSTPCGSDTNNLRPRWLHHAIEYSTASLYDFLRRYFAVVQRPEEADFPHKREVFDQLQGSKVDYHMRLNPVLCREPIHIDNPYRPRV